MSGFLTKHADCRMIYKLYLSFIWRLIIFLNLSLKLGLPTILLKLNNFDQNFMKLGHIVIYHNVKYPKVFIKFDNVQYHTTPSGVIALCLWK